MNTTKLKKSLMLPLATVTLSSFAMQFDELKVLSEGEVLEITENTVFAKGLSGKGRVVNKSTSTMYTLTFQGGTADAPCVFDGSIDGKFELYTKYGNQHFANPDVQTKGHTTEGWGHLDGAVGGTFGFASFAGLGGNFIDHTGFRLLWLGQQSETVKPGFTFFGSDTAAFEIDAGTFGGLTLDGVWSLHSSSPYQRMVVLTGDNPEACVVTNRLLRIANENSPSGGYSFHVVKRGGGIWEFAEGTLTNGQQPFSGAITVESGTLRFDSLAEKGTVCALGTALDLYEAKNGTSSQAVDPVAYAVKLGNANGGATLEYVGVKAGSSSSRPLAIDGKARLTNASDSKFAFADVYPVAEDSVLTLDGAAPTAESSLSGLNDRKDGATGNLSLVKDGTGTWTLSGANDIHGTIAVKQGTLVLKNRYTWYRWNIKATQLMNGGTGNSTQVQADEFGLYSADGIRQNRGFDGYDDLATLSAGQVCFGFNKGTWTPKYTPVETEALRMCDDTNISGAEWYQTSIGTVSHQTPDDPSTWLPLVVRLPETAPTVVGYDVAISVSAINPLVWSVDASVDGVNWDEVFPTVTNQATQAGWQYAGRTHATNSDEKHLDADGNPDMKPFVRTTPVTAEEFLPHVSSYSVAAGATLKIVGEVTLKGLSVDPQGAGTIEGGTLAENGTIEVLGDVRGAVELPLDLSKIGGTANLANWQVKIGGAVKKWSVNVVDSKIVLTPPGAVLFLR